MLNVGIHENVNVLKPKKDEQGRLQVLFRSASKETEQIDEFEMMGEASTKGSDSGVTAISFFVPGLKGYNSETKQMDRDKTYSEMMADFNDMKAQMSHILEQFVSLDQIKRGFENWTESTGINRENYKEMFLDSDVIAHIYGNYANLFIKMMEEHVDETKEFRVIFVRTSKKSAYPKLRNKFLSDYPFIEPMTVEAAKTKIRFTASEIKGKLNSGEALTPDPQAQEDSTLAATFGDD